MVEVRDINTLQLKARLVLHGDTQKKLAKAMGISLSRLNQKLNQKGASFNKSEIEFLVRRYNLTGDEIMKIFFAEEVSD